MNIYTILNLNKIQKNINNYYLIKILYLKYHKLVHRKHNIYVYEKAVVHDSRLVV